MVAGGFALVNKNKLTILVNEAELGSVCFFVLIFITQLFLFGKFCYISFYFVVTYKIKQSFRV